MKRVVRTKSTRSDGAGPKARPLQFKLSDLAALLRAAPKPDAGYWDTLEEILQGQAPVQSSPWVR